MASSTPPPPVLSGACWPDPDPSPSKPILADDVTRMNAVAVVSGRLGKGRVVGAAGGGGDRVNGIQHPLI